MFYPLKTSFHPYLGPNVTFKFENCIIFLLSGERSTSSKCQLSRSLVIATVALSISFYPAGLERVNKPQAYRLKSSKSIEITK